MRRPRNKIAWQKLNKIQESLKQSGSEKGFRYEREIGEVRRSQILKIIIMLSVYLL